MAGDPEADFDVTDSPSICREINEKAYEYVMSIVPDSVKQRYQDFGTRMIFGNDTGPYNMGPLFIHEPLVYKKTTDESGAKVLEI